MDRMLGGIIGASCGRTVRILGHGPGGRGGQVRGLHVDHGFGSIDESRERGERTI